MPNTGISQYGEEFFLRFNAEGNTGNPYTIVLFDDTSETGFDEAFDIGDLTTEPSQTGSGYNRQTVSFSVSITGSDPATTELVADTTVSFASLASFAASKVVTAYGVVTDGVFQWNGNPSAVHMVFSGSLSQPRNLADFDQLNVDNIGGELGDPDEVTGGGSPF